MRIQDTYRAILIGCLALLAKLAFASEALVVIVNKDAPVQKLSQEQIKNVFLGESPYAEPDKRIEVGKRDRNLPVYRDFYEALAHMSPKDVAVHWAKKVFSGEASTPTRITGDDEAAKQWVRSKPSGISFIYAKNLDGTVRSVGTINH